MPFVVMYHCNKSQYFSFYISHALVTLLFVCITAGGACQWQITTNPAELHHLCSLPSNGREMLTVFTNLWDSQTDLLSRYVTLYDPTTTVDALLHPQMQDIEHGRISRSLYATKGFFYLSKNKTKRRCFFRFEDTFLWALRDSRWLSVCIRLPSCFVLGCISGEALKGSQLEAMKAATPGSFPPFFEGTAKWVVISAHRTL